jgi:hypothetical protein
MKRFTILPLLLLAAFLSIHCKKSSAEERSDAFNALLGVWHWEAYFIDQYGDGLEFELDDCDADDTWEFKSSTKLALADGGVQCEDEPPYYFEADWALQSADTELYVSFGDEPHDPKHTYKIVTLTATKLVLERADEDNPTQIIERMLLKR